MNKHIEFQTMRAQFWLIASFIGFASVWGATLESSPNQDGILKVDLVSDCPLTGVESDSFKGGLLGEWMRVDLESFVASGDRRRFSVNVDVSGVPMDQVASIGFSSYGVVDECTHEMLALVDPLVFRLSSRHEGGRRM